MSDTDRPEVRLSRPRYSEADLNPGVVITIQGQFDNQRIEILARNGGGYGLSLAIKAEGCPIVYAFGDFEIDDNRSKLSPPTIEQAAYILNTDRDR